MSVSVGGLRNCILFCFFKQKTADELRISDWSSDVCSSDLSERDVLGNAFGRMQGYLQGGVATAGEIARGNLVVQITPASDRDALGLALIEMRDAIHQDRKSVV